MKITNSLKIGLIIFAFFAFCNVAGATVYYVDDVGGSDANSGTSTLAAWQTINKVSSSTLVAGDSVLLKKSGFWNEKLIVSTSSIAFNSYGSGANPFVAQLDYNQKINIGINNIDFGPWFYMTHGDVVGDKSSTYGGLGYGRKVLLANNTGDIFRYENSVLSQVGDGGATSSAQSLFISSAGTVFASWAGGIWRSIDNGDNWTKTLTFEQTDGRTISFAEDNQGNIYVGQYSLLVSSGAAKLYKSIDDGATWPDITPESFGAARHVHYVYWCPYRNKLFVALGDLGSNVVYSSDDHGATFSLWGSAEQSVAIVSDANYVYGVRDTGGDRFIWRAGSDGIQTKVFETADNVIGWWGHRDEYGNIIFAVDTDGDTQTNIIASFDQGDHWSTYYTKSGRYLATFALPSYYYNDWDGFYYGGGGVNYGAKWRLYPNNAEFKVASTGTDYLVDGINHPWKTLEALNGLTFNHPSSIKINSLTAGIDDPLVLRGDNITVDGNNNLYGGNQVAFSGLSDGLEGVSPFTSLTQTNGTVSTSTAQVHAGSVALAASSTAASGVSYANKTIDLYDEGSTVWMRGWVYVANPITSASNFDIFRLGNTSTAATTLALRVLNTNNISIKLNSVGRTYSVLQSAEPFETFPTGQWVKLKIKVKVSDTVGSIIVWQDDKIILNAAGLDTLLVGKSWNKALWGVYADQSDALVYWDDIALGSTDPDRSAIISISGSNNSIKNFNISSDNIAITGHNNIIDYNLINNSPAGVSIGAGTIGNKIYNNTFVDGVTGINDGGSSTSIINNIFSQQSSNAIIYSGDGQVENNNLIFNTTLSGLTADGTDIALDPQFFSSSTSNFQLKYYSPAVDSGIVISGLTQDYLGNAFYGSPDLGAYEFQPSLSLSGNLISTSSPITVYSNGKLNYKTATSSSALADFQVGPIGGFSTSLQNYMDVSLTNWSMTGQMNKEWIATSSVATTTIFTIGDLQADTDYAVSVDSVAGDGVVSGSSCSGAICTSDVDGKISFNYTGGFSTHIFDLEMVMASSTYYVDAVSGNDSNSGTAIGSAWQTISKVNSLPLVPGDNILFKKGQTWRETLTVPSSGNVSSTIVFGAYGEGNKPRITGADLVTDWSVESENIWKSTLATQPLRVAINSELGNLASSLAGVNSSTNWFWGTSTLYIYSIADPASSTVEAGKRSNSINANGKSYITFDGLQMDLANGSSGAGVWISGAGATKVKAQNCEIKWNRHGVVFYTTDAQAGNHTIDSCQIHDNEASGIFSNAGTDGSTSSTRTTISNNTVYNNDGFGIFAYASNWLIERNLVYNNGNYSIAPGYSGIHLWGGDVGSPTANTGDYNIVRYNKIYGTRSLGEDGSGISADIYSDHNQIYDNIVYANDGPGITLFANDSNEIYNNTSYSNCLNTGGQLTLKGEIRIDGIVSEKVKNFIVKNNIAYATGSDVAAIYLNQYAYDQSPIIANNLWYASSANWYFWNTAGGSSLDAWNLLEGVVTDLNSNPVFVNAPLDFTLQASSDAIDAGTNVGLTSDYAGTVIPKGLTFDIGAYEFNESTGPIVSIISPASGSTVSGNIPLTATVTDGSPIASVQFSIDGSNFGLALNSSPYMTHWNTLTSANTAHVISVVATDIYGNSATATATIIVNNYSSGGGASYTHIIPVPLNPVIVVTTSPSKPTSTETTISSSTAKQPSEPILIRYLNSPNIYLLENNQKSLIRSVEAFVARGYDWKNVKNIEPDKTYPNGPDITLPKNIIIFVKDLKSGQTSPQIKLLQQKLNALGFLVSKKGAGSLGRETNYFGPATKQALIKFQKAYNLKPANGILSSLTRIKINLLMVK
ncbi:MAG: right-handed parallel beta-helix repeat-containing protein [Candidatus Buchananbacteria bacterium]